MSTWALAKCHGCGMQSVLVACTIQVRGKSREYDLCRECRKPLEALLAKKGRPLKRPARAVAVRERDIPDED